MVRDLQQREARILTLALHDGETGLLNRLGLEHRLIEMLARRTTPVAVAAFAGDSALVARLARFNDRWRVARLDERTFAAAFPAATPDAAREEIGQVGAPAGFALAPGHGEDAAALIDAAEHALRQAGEQGAVLALYAPAPAKDHAALMASMRAALSTGAMTLLHQPKFDLAAGVVTGTEALARWRDEKRGAVSPDLFVTVAEQTGDIRVLTEWALTQAIADAHAFADAGRDLLVSVNLSARLLEDAAFAAWAVEQVRKAGVRLCFEITETAVINQPAMARELLASFALAGIKIAIDDYGARLSSLSYLTTLKADELKIDKSFILGIDKPREAELVATVTDLAHDLGLAVTAEGVETRAVLERLATLGCDMAQGNFIGPAMRRDEVLALLAGA
jgi:EAL domain-containing protein (putative c-di-GMP-specific phosphodiesterase class I)